MTPKEEKELTEHIDAIAKILYRQAKPGQIETLAKIEETVREQTLEYISPRIGFFLSNKPPKQQQEDTDISKVSSGNLKLGGNRRFAQRSAG